MKIRWADPAAAGAVGVAMAVRKKKKKKETSVCWCYYAAISGARTEVDTADTRYPSHRGVFLSRRTENPNWGKIHALFFPSALEQQRRKEWKEIKFHVLYRKHLLHSRRTGLDFTFHYLNVYTQSSSTRCAVVSFESNLDKTVLSSNAFLFLLPNLFLGGGICSTSL